MINHDSFPECFGHYPNRDDSTDCINCPLAQSCKKVVARKCLGELLQRVEKVQSILRGTDWKQN